EPRRLHSIGLAHFEKIHQQMAGRDSIADLYSRFARALWNQLRKPPACEIVQLILRKNDRGAAPGTPRVDQMDLVLDIGRSTGQRRLAFVRRHESRHEREKKAASLHISSVSENCE